MCGYYCYIHIVFGDGAVKKVISKIKHSSNPVQYHCPSNVVSRWLPFIYDHTVDYQDIFEYDVEYSRGPQKMLANCGQIQDSNRSMG